MTCFEQTFLKNIFLSLIFFHLNLYQIFKISSFIFKAITDIELEITFICLRLLPANNFISRQPILCVQTASSLSDFITAFTSHLVPILGEKFISAGKRKSGSPYLESVRASPLTLEAATSTLTSAVASFNHLIQME